MAPVRGRLEAVSRAEFREAGDHTEFRGCVFDARDRVAGGVGGCGCSGAGYEVLRVGDAASEGEGAVQDEEAGVGLDVGIGYEGGWCV